LVANLFRKLKRNNLAGAFARADCLEETQIE